MKLLVGHKDGMLAEGFGFCTHQLSLGKILRLTWEGWGDREFMSPSGKKHDLKLCFQ